MSLTVKLSFSLNTKQVFFEDLTSYASLEGKLGTLEIVFPDTSTQTVVIDLANGETVASMSAPLELSGGAIDEGEYDVTYNVTEDGSAFDSFANVFQYFNPTVPEPSIEQSYNATAGTFKSTDITDYSIDNYTMTSMSREHVVSYPSIGGYAEVLSEDSEVTVLNPMQGRYTTTLNAVLEYEMDIEGFYIVVTYTAVKVFSSTTFYVGAANLYDRYLELKGTNFAQAEFIKEKWFMLMSEVTLYNEAITAQNTIAASEHLAAIDAILNANYN